MHKKTILLGITGGIAAIKIPKLITLLISHNIQIIPIMTKNACHIIDPQMIEKAAQSEVYTALFSKNYSTQQIITTHAVDHIALADQADLVVIAPATANTIAKLTHGIADNMLTTTVLATHAPILLCPSMNTHMWSNPAVQENITILAKRGVIILPPESGPLACGYEGPGRLPSIQTITQEIMKLLDQTTLLQGKKIVITSGGTQEPIDDVRCITNKSSGIMGAALADACIRAGGKVTYLHAQNARIPTYTTQNYSFTTTDDLTQLLHTHVPHVDILFHVAAVSDFSLTPKKGKISSNTNLILTLTPKEKLYKTIKKLNKHIKLITFKAETSMSEENWNTTLQSIINKTDIDTIIGNPIDAPQQGFSSEYNEVFIRTRTGTFLHMSKESKTTLANNIISFLFSSTTV